MEQLRDRGADVQDRPTGDASSSSAPAASRACNDLFIMPRTCRAQCLLARRSKRLMDVLTGPLFVLSLSRHASSCRNPGALPQRNWWSVLRGKELGGLSVYRSQVHVKLPAIEPGVLGTHGPANGPWQRARRSGVPTSPMPRTTRRGTTSRCRAPWLAVAGEQTGSASTRHPSLPLATPVRGRNCPCHRSRSCCPRWARAWPRPPSSNG